MGKATPSVDPDRLIDEKTVFLHLLVEGRTIDVEDSRGLLAIPVEGLKGLDDDAFLGFLESLLECRMPIGRCGRAECPADPRV